MIVKWIQPKVANKSWIIAGNPAIPKTSKGNGVVDQELPPLRTDPWSNPWSNYQPTAPSGGNKSSSAMPAAITRKLEAPIEQRFDAQQKNFDDLKEDTKKQIDDLKAGLQAVQGQIGQVAGAVESHQTNVKQEFDAIRAETAQQFKELSSSFGDSLTRAMSRQDAALTSQLSELKQLLQNRPTPAKKAKSAPPSSDAIQVDEERDENL